MKYILFISMVLIVGCSKPETLFVQLSSAHTGINFNYKIVENDSINPLDLEFLYNGGGVAVGDLVMDCPIYILLQAPHQTNYM